MKRKCRICDTPSGTHPHCRACEKAFLRSGLCFWCGCNARLANSSYCFDCHKGMLKNRDASRGDLERMKQ